MERGVYWGYEWEQEEHLAVREFGRKMGPEE